MTREQRKKIPVGETQAKIRDIELLIQATTRVLVAFGDIRRENGRTLSTTITDLFAEIRELKAISGPDVD